MFSKNMTAQMLQIWLKLKKGGGVRFGIDNRFLNFKIRKYEYILPTFDDIVDNLSGSPLKDSFTLN